MIALTSLMLLLLHLFAAPQAGEAANNPGADAILMRATEVAQALGLSKSKVHMLILDGTLPHVRFGRSVRVPRAALIDFIARQTVNAIHEDAA